MGAGSSDSLAVRKARLVAMGQVRRLSEDEAVRRLAQLWPGLAPGHGFTLDDRELVRALCERLGIEVEFRRVNLNWKEAA